MSKDSSVTAKTVVVAQSGCEEVPRNVYQVPQGWCHLHCREKSSAPFSEQGQTEQVIKPNFPSKFPFGWGAGVGGAGPKERPGLYLEPCWLWCPGNKLATSLRVLARARAKLSAEVETTEFLCFRVVAKKGVKVGLGAGEGIRRACCSGTGQRGRESNCWEEAALGSWTPKITGWLVGKLCACSA